MKIKIKLPFDKLKKITAGLSGLGPVFTIFTVSLTFALLATLYFLGKNYILSYGDAESHINISKRILHSLTPGLAQMGGIWLPLPHFMMLPFVYFDSMWHTGLAGSIVGGLSYVISCIFIFKLALYLTNNKPAALFSFLVFALNPNILYLQSTPMTELPLIMFFILSSYFFVRYISNEKKLVNILLAGFFGFCAVLSRYDGWFLVAIEAGTLFLNGLIHRDSWKKTEGKIILFSTLAFFGIALWMLWDYLILGDPFYFTNSQFSARTQQLSWLKRGELPAYHNVVLSFLYYIVTSMSNSGILIFFVALAGLILYVFYSKDKHRFAVITVLLTPFIFNIFTLYMGQSVIFIPHLTPVGFEWRLFNVRYGVIALPVISVLVSFVFVRLKKPLSKAFLISFIFLQFLLNMIGYSKVISLEDGINGLSQAKVSDAEKYIQKKYDHGLVLLDDYARSVSVVRSGIPMQNIIYVGNKPYWEESLRAPEKYARWIIIQKDDDVWKRIYANEYERGRMYKYFKKVYTSPQILIFKKITNN